MSDFFFCPILTERGVSPHVFINVLSVKLNVNPPSVSGAEEEGWSGEAKRLISQINEGAYQLSVQLISVAKY